MGIMIGSPPLVWGLILWFILVTAYSIDVSTQLVLYIAYLKKVIEIQVHFLFKKKTDMLLSPIYKILKS